MFDKIKLISSRNDLNSFNGLKSKLSAHGNDMDSLVISIFDMYSTSTKSLIVPVPIEYVLQIKSYGWTYTRNSFIDLNYHRVTSVTKEDIEKSLNKIIQDTVIEVPENIILGITDKLSKKQDNQISNMVKNIFATITKVEEKGIHFVSEPIYQLFKLYEKFKDSVVPIIQDIIDAVDKTWLGKLFRELFNVSAIRPTNELTATSVRLFNSDDEYNSCEEYICNCKDNTASNPLFNTQNKNLLTNNNTDEKEEHNTFKVLLPEEPVIGFRHTYAENTSIISTVGYYLFELSCLQVPNVIGVEGIYRNRKEFYQTYNNNPNIKIF